MKTIEIGDARQRLGKYAGHGEDLPLVITDHGRPIAALLPVPNTDMETVSLSANAKFIALVDRSRQRQSKEGGISSDEMRRRLKKEISRRQKALRRLIAKRDEVNSQIAELEALGAVKAAAELGKKAGRTVRQLKS